MPKYTRYYIAFGANAHPEMMKQRCPKARLLGVSEIQDWKLVFRGTADVTPCTNEDYQAGVDRVPVVFWSITHGCEQTLDMFEGFPIVYTKKEFSVKHPKIDKYVKAMAYVMAEPEVGVVPPVRGYFQSIAHAYHRFQLPKRLLEIAYERSYRGKE